MIYISFTAFTVASWWWWYNLIGVISVAISFPIFAAVSASDAVIFSSAFCSELCCFSCCFAIVVPIFGLAVMP